MRKKRIKATKGKKNMAVESAEQEGVFINHASAKMTPFTVPNKLLQLKYPYTT